ncbi:MAG: hypothetical protein RBT75_11655 [Anaerolineae bacterium]|nr:hypothetical protein [Anaerolineae bacterium]
MDHKPPGETWRLWLHGGEDQGQTSGAYMSVVLKSHLFELLQRNQRQYPTNHCPLPAVKASVIIGWSTKVGVHSKIAAEISKKR